MRQAKRRARKIVLLMRGVFWGSHVLGPALPSASNHRTRACMLSRGADATFTVVRVRVRGRGRLFTGHHPHCAGRWAVTPRRRGESGALSTSTLLTIGAVRSGGYWVVVACSGGMFGLEAPNGVPLGAGRGLDEGGHAVAVDELRLAEVDDVEDDALVGADVVDDEVEPDAVARVARVRADEQVVLVLCYEVHPSQVS